MIISLLLIIIFTFCPSPGQLLNDSNNETSLQAADADAFSNESESSVPKDRVYLCARMRTGS
jgi:hypothetical protein